MESASTHKVRGHVPTTENTDTDAGKGVSSLFVCTGHHHIGGWYSTMGLHKQADAVTAKYVRGDEN